MDYQEAIETVQDIHDVAETRIKSGDARGVVYINPNRLTDLKYAISAMQELQAIHNNGISLECLNDIDFRKQVVEHINYMEYMDIKDELEEYKQIGTLEEVRGAVEKQRKVKPEDAEYCPICHTFLKDEDDAPGFYCMNCGQAIDWSEAEE